MNPQDIELYKPINILKPIADNIWIVDGSTVQMAMYGTKIPFPTRMTIVRLSNGELWCHIKSGNIPTIKKRLKPLFYKVRIYG